MTMRQYRDRTERRGQAEDEVLRQALAIGSPGAMAAAVARLREAAALDQLRALLQP
ncbi:hypothetical protein QFZ27_001717 [Inquilinus ginsengisoli]|uniref:hypothetical protein n=1 Tax=Inquilinus ginsengisoli TaxID=363840 RepID=UPI003D194E56